MAYTTATRNHNRFHDQNVKYSNTDRQLVGFAWLRSAVHAVDVFPPRSSAAVVSVRSPTQHIVVHTRIGALN